MLDTILAYTAGLLDGEGTIGIYRKPNGSIYVNLSICNTDGEIIEWLQKHFDGHIHQRKRLNPRSKILYQWYLGQQGQILEFLNLLEPFIIIKKRQFQIALSFISTKNLCDSETLDEYRSFLHSQMKEANKRGG